MFLLKRLLVCFAIATLLCFAGGQSSKKGSTPAQRYALAGHITGLGGSHRVMIKVTGSHTYSTVSRTDGSYEIRNVLPGSYDVRPSSPAYLFAPTFHSAAITTHDVRSVNFTARPKPTPRR